MPFDQARWPEPFESHDLDPSLRPRYNAAAVARLHAAGVLRPGWLERLTERELSNAEAPGIEQAPDPHVVRVVVRIGEQLFCADYRLSPALAWLPPDELHHVEDMTLGRLWDQIQEHIRRYRRG